MKQPYKTSQGILSKTEYLSILDTCRDKIIEIPSDQINIFGLLSLYGLYNDGKFDSYEEYLIFILEHRKEKNISLLKGDAMYIYLLCLLYQSTNESKYLGIAL